MRIKHTISMNILFNFELLVFNLYGGFEPVLYH